jgi:predicted ArsR family transcriptional regulator
MDQTRADATRISDLPVPLNRDVFTRSLIRELAGVLEDVVGLREAAGYISVVGQSIGRQINNDYRIACRAPELSRKEVADVLVDLKRRIEGDFYIIEESEDRIVLGNRSCPFGDKVIGRPSMCMMTSNVFGVIAAENLGYSRIELQETIAKGNAECRVVVHLRPTPEAVAAEGREYYQTTDA